MRTYTTDEARKIVLNCSKEYNKTLLNKKFIIIYIDRTDKNIKFLEIEFKKENFQHLTGIELIDNIGEVRKHVADLFYVKCVNNTLSNKEMKFKDDGTTNLKLLALPYLSSIHKVTKIAGIYNGSRPYLIADKLIGNINFCLGLKELSNYYVPSSILSEDVKMLTENQHQVLAILSKTQDEKIYETIKYVAKGINLNNIKFSKDIIEIISLNNYIHK